MADYYQSIRDNEHDDTQWCWLALAAVSTIKSLLHMSLKPTIEDHWQSGPNNLLLNEMNLKVAKSNNLGWLLLVHLWIMMLFVNGGADVCLVQRGNNQMINGEKTSIFLFNMVSMTLQRQTWLELVHCCLWTFGSASGKWIIRTSTLLCAYWCICDCLAVYPGAMWHPATQTSSAKR